MRGSSIPLPIHTAAGIPRAFPTRRRSTTRLAVTTTSSAGPRSGCTRRRESRPGSTRPWPSTTHNSQARRSNGRRPGTARFGPRPAASPSSIPGGRCDTRPTPRSWHSCTPTPSATTTVATTTSPSARSATCSATIPPGEATWSATARTRRRTRTTAGRAASTTAGRAIQPRAQRAGSLTPPRRLPGRSAAYCTRTHSIVFDMMPEPATISKPAGVVRMVIGTN